MSSKVSPNEGSRVEDESTRTLLKGVVLDLVPTCLALMYISFSVPFRVYPIISAP